MGLLGRQLFELDFDILLQLFVNLDSSALIWIPQCHFAILKGDLVFLSADLVFLSVILCSSEAILHSSESILCSSVPFFITFRFETLLLVDTRSHSMVINPWKYVAMPNLF